jgi:hypothetical protein
MKISKIRIVQNKNSSFLMFYSFGQAASFLVAVCLGIGVMEVIGYFGFDMNMFSWSGVIAATCCAMPSVFLAREAAFEIGGSDCMEGYAAISQRLIFYRFEKQDRQGDGKVEQYQSNLPKLLRWEKSGVTVSIRSGYVSIIGPYGTLISLRKFLSRSVVT